MAIKAADTLKPNGSFALAEAADIDINGQSLTDYLANLSAGKGDPGTGIKSVTTAAVENGTSVTITLDDAKETKTVFTVANGEQGPQGIPGETGATGPQGDAGASCHATIVETTDDDGTKHSYVKVWDGDDDSAATTSSDLMAQVNEVLAAVEEIMKSYTGSTTE